ncbi:MAG: hypothetical protein Q9217_000333 [Psora testacea]
MNAIRSPLLRCPGEIRMRIYEYVVTSDEIYITPCKRRKSIKSDRRRCKNILATCQQIRYEALDLYYQLNTFRFCDGGTMDKYIKSLSAVAIAAIKDVYCDFLLLNKFLHEARDLDRLDKFLRPLLGLRKLTFHDFRGGYVIFKTQSLPPTSNAAWVRARLPDWLDVVVILDHEGAHRSEPQSETVVASLGDGDEADDGLTDFERQLMEGARLEGTHIKARAVEW